MFTKQPLLTLALVLLILPLVWGQRDNQITARGIPAEDSYQPTANFAISSDRKAMSEGTQNALTLQLQDADRKMVSKLWMKFAQDHLDVKPKYDRKSEQYLMPEADVNGRTANAYAAISERGSNSELVLWVQMDAENFLNPYDHAADYTETEDMLTEFALLVERTKVENEVDEEEKELKKLQRELHKLEKEQQQAERDIEKAKETIRKAEAAIEQSIVDQESKAKDIDAQEKVIEGVRKKLKKI